MHFHPGIVLGIPMFLQNKNDALQNIIQCRESIEYIF